jgi:hypothetical protein
MANGDATLMTVTMAKIVLAIAQAIIIVLLVAVGSQVLRLRESQAVMEERITNMSYQIQVMGNQIDRHISLDTRGGTS